MRNRIPSSLAIIAALMLAISFLGLLAINLLQAWNRRRTGGE